eukprot:1161362-Pelagomonas_calceolata.AAC.7
MVSLIAWTAIRTDHTSHSPPRTSISPRQESNYCVEAHMKIEKTNMQDMVDASLQLRQQAAALAYCEADDAGNGMSSTGLQDRSANAALYLEFMLFLTVNFVLSCMQMDIRKAHATHKYAPLLPARCACVSTVLCSMNMCIGMLPLKCPQVKIVNRPGALC